MKLPLQVAFRNMPHSAEIEALVAERAERLDRYAGDIMGCRVVVEEPHKHHRHGNAYQIRVDLTLPGKEIVVNRETTADADIHVAIREAFDAARRQVEDYIRQRRGEIKAHEGLPHARVSKLFPAEGYGFLETPGGKELYFHKNSVLHEGFDKLAVGTEVTYVEEAGLKGPQASTVKLVGRHHHQ